MKKTLVFVLLTAFLTISSVLYGGYTEVGTGERTVELLLEGIYGGDFSNSGDYYGTASTAYTSNWWYYGYSAPRF